MAQTKAPADTAKTSAVVQHKPCLCVQCTKDKMELEWWRDFQSHLTDRSPRVGDVLLGHRLKVQRESYMATWVDWVR